MAYLNQEDISFSTTQPETLVCPEPEPCPDCPECPDPEPEV